MHNRKQSSTNELTGKPKHIFLMDALGALLTSVVFIGILVPLSSCFGMPRQVLHLLSGLAFICFITSFIGYRFIKSNWKLFLKIIIVLNLIYLIITIFLLIKHAQGIMEIGWIYFSIEFAVIGIFIALEV